jgi:hypothetical protein
MPRRMNPTRGTSETSVDGRVRGMRALCPAFLLLLAGCATLQTQVEINAPASAVRQVLFDFDDYPKWNPFITKVDGTVAEGSEIYVTVVPAGGPEINANAKVLLVKPDHLAWKGSGLSQVGSGPVSVDIPGVLSAKHDFIIEELGPDRTLFRNDDDFSGAAVATYDMKPIKAGLDAMNEALKKRVEAGAK